MQSADSITLTLETGGFENMQNYRLYRIILKPRSPLHIGDKEGIYNITEQFIHSDTLFSGIINCYCMLFGNDETERLVESFCSGNFPFRISSAMPRIKDAYYVYKPLSLDLMDKLRSDDYKKVKKIRFIPEETLVNGFGHGKYQMAGQFLVPNEDNIDETSAYFIEREIERVAVDRVTHATNLFYYSQCVAGKDASLWFYLKVSEDVKKNVLAAIRLLCDEGIGGERSIGLGCFDFEKLEAEEISCSNADSFVNLSVYSPKSQEELSALTDYELDERAGYIYSVFSNKNIKRKKIKVLTEGSTFSRIVDGRVVDVTPESFKSHRVIRYALSYLLPYKT